MPTKERNTVNSRDLVLRNLNGRMERAFAKGETVDARNIECWISSLEELSPDAYERMVAEAESSEETEPNALHPGGT